MPKRSNPLSPTLKKVLWTVGMLASLGIAGLLLADLYPELWKSLFDVWVAKIIGIVAALTVITILLVIGGSSLRWTGFRTRKLWDWQSLLLVPLSLALIASLITLYQTTRQQEVENDRAKEARELEALQSEREITQAYLEDMGTFMLEKGLLKADENDAVRLLARARTLAVLDSVSGERKIRVLNFLSETDLIQFGPKGEEPVISLRFADLREARLVNRSILSNTDLDRAELIDAKLTGAKLTDAMLAKADLRGAILSDTVLHGADLRGADLRGAKEWTEKRLSKAESLVGATMPDGQKLKSDDNPDGPTFEEWAKSKGSKKHGENK